MSSSLVGDQLYLITSVLYTASVIGALAYDLSLPKTGATTVYTGAVAYAGISAPVLAYSVLFLLYKDLALGFFFFSAYLPYFILYSLLIGAFSYDYFTQYTCLTTFTQPKLDAANSYICGQVTGYETQGSYIPVLAFTFAQLGLQSWIFAIEIIRRYEEWLFPHFRPYLLF